MFKVVRCDVPSSDKTVLNAQTYLLVNRNMTEAIGRSKQTRLRKNAI